MSSPQHLLIVFPVSAPLLSRIRSTLPFTTVSYYPCIYVAGTKHPHAVWSYEPAEVPDDVWANATVLLTMFITPDSRAQAPNLRLVQGMSAGVEWLLAGGLFRELEAQGSEMEVAVASASGVHAPAIAEYVIMQSLNALHRQAVLWEIQHVDRRWARTKYVPAGELPGSPELRGSAMGILGYGCIGRECARLASAFGMRILAANSSGKRSRARGFTIEGTGDPDGAIPEAWYNSNEPSSLKDFLEQVHILVLACPLTSATKNLISATTIKHLKKTAYVINIARGPVIDHEALYAALEEGRIAGAALDVTDPEPLPEGHKLWKARNCVITPHISGATTMYETRCVDLLEINLKRLVAGEGILNKVDVSKGY